MRLSAILLIALTLMGAFVSPLWAQRYATENFGKGALSVTVQYMVRLPLKADDLASQREAMEQGRKLFYGMASSECALIVATFAGSCQLTNLSVQTNIARQIGDNSATMTANAQFRVELKPKPDDKRPDASP